MNIQLDLFEPNDDETLFEKQLALMADSMRRNHKAQFAKLSEMMKFIIEFSDKKDKEIFELRKEIEKLREMQVKQVK